MKKLKCRKCGYDNKWDAAYCGLCYEPLGKKAAPPAEKTSAAAAPAPARPARPLRPLLRTGLFVAGVTLAAALLLPNLPDPVLEGSVRDRVNRFAEKTGAADRLLAGLSAQRDKLLADIAAAPPDPEAFGIQGAHTARMMKLEDDYANAVNALALPCPTCVDKEKDAAYLAWADDHLRRENEAAKSFSDRYHRLLQKALPGR